MGEKSTATEDLRMKKKLVLRDLRAAVSKIIFCY